MQEYYFELKIKPKKRYDLFLDLITTLTQNAIEEDSGYIISRSEDNLSEIEYGIKAFAKELEIECETELTKKKNEDWIRKYQDAVKPIEVGKFYVHPSWKESKEGKIDILIDPALAFGSGHHETTNSCLSAISEFVNKNDEVLDVGTGSGILAIAATKLGACSDICDTDELAIQNAKENFKINKTQAGNSWVGSVTMSKKKYDVIIANIVADVLIMISSDLKKNLKNNGKLILSGILDKHIDKVLSKFNNFKQLKIIHKNEWVTVVLTKGE